MNVEANRHADLKPKEVFGWDGNGNIWVDGGEAGLLRYRVFVMPGGNLKAEPVPLEGTDQEGGESKKPTKAERHRGVDQA